MMNVASWRFPFLLGLSLAALRLTLGLLLIWMARSSPESHMLVLADVPSLAVTFIVAALTGWPSSISDAADVSFFAIALITWFSVGFFTGSFVLWRARRISRGAG